MITTQYLLDLLPLVADQPWHLTSSGAIRNGRGQCPICALVDVSTEGVVSYRHDAITALQDMLGTELSLEEYKTCQGFMEAADTAEDDMPVYGYSHMVWKDRLRLRQDLLDLLTLEEDAV